MPRKTKITDANKPWNLRKTKVQPYQEDYIPIEKTFRIICEGENTEPEYFKAFPVKTAKVDSYGLGSSRKKLVELVIEIVKDEGEQENWVVFDMDIQRDNVAVIKKDFEEAIKLAEEHDIKVAYANDAFELWILLHYMYFDNEWTRHEYYEKLSDLWEINYEKSCKKLSFCKSIYQKLAADESANQQEAMRRAKKLFDEQKDKTHSERNPCTTIHCLVNELNKHISKDSFIEDLCSSIK